MSSVAIDRHLHVQNVRKPYAYVRTSMYQRMLGFNYRTRFMDQTVPAQDCATFRRVFYFRKPPAYAMPENR